MMTFEGLLRYVQMASVVPQWTSFQILTVHKTPHLPSVCLVQVEQVPQHLAEGQLGFHWLWGDYGGGSIVGIHGSGCGQWQGFMSSKGF